MDRELAIIKEKERCGLTSSGRDVASDDVAATSGSSRDAKLARANGFGIKNGVQRTTELCKRRKDEG